ncbi:hypothetical protein [Sphingopyxis sp. JAI128]|uniref:hypothetical protein n=1 Tax=Sphingopyxis sp. JAI128 TaxID=2723066 RepID=UPI00161EDC7A|nr:hypothetical protein [Sphingopyxis sp. JAI128]MBB6424984.1 hypothetical protein [Sphingopyxis sp. JAI128]
MNASHMRRIADPWQPTFHREYERAGFVINAWRGNAAHGRTGYFSLFRERKEPHGLIPIIQAGTRQAVRNALRSARQEQRK